MPAASLPSRPFRVALLGAGRVGTAVAEALKSKGHSVAGVWSRTPESAAAAAARLGSVRCESPSMAVRAANLVLIGTTDRAIAPVAAAAAPDLSPGTAVIHFAGSLGIDPLAPARHTAVVAALHPVQALPDVDTALLRLPGSAWAITCWDDLRSWASRLVSEELAGVPVWVAEEDRPLWHAAAVVTSNGIAALMSTGAAILARIGVERSDVVLGPLATGTVANVSARGGGGDAFTGPVVRGDDSTIEAHLDALGERAPDLLDEYVLATRAIVAGASRSARIDPSSAAAMRRLLERA